MWYVVITGNELTLANLAKTLQIPSITIFSKRNEYWLQSDRFEECSSASDVHELAQQFIPVINTIARLTWQAIDPISLGRVIEITENGEEKGYIFVQAIATGQSEITIEAIVVGPDGKIIPAPRPNKQEKWIELALNNPLIKEAMYYFSQEHSWFNLYKIYEIISKSPKEKMAYWSDSEKRAFTNSADNMSISKWGSRHSSVKESPKENKTGKLTLQEADEWIRNVFILWLNDLIERESEA